MVVDTSTSASSETTSATDSSISTSTVSSTTVYTSTSASPVTTSPTDSSTSSSTASSTTEDTSTSARTKTTSATDSSTSFSTDTSTTVDTSTSASTDTTFTTASSTSSSIVSSTTVVSSMSTESSTPTDSSTSFSTLSSTMVDTQTPSPRYVPISDKSYLQTTSVGPFSVKINRSWNPAFSDNTSREFDVLEHIARHAVGNEHFGLSPPISRIVTLGLSNGSVIYQYIVEYNTSVLLRYLKDNDNVNLIEYLDNKVLPRLISNNFSIEQYKVDRNWTKKNFIKSHKSNPIDPCYRVNPALCPLGYKCANPANRSTQLNIKCEDRCYGVTCSGNGACYTSHASGEPYCVCNESYTGSECSAQSVVASSEQNVIAISLGAVFGVLLIAIIFTVIIIFVRRRKKRQQSSNLHRDPLSVEALFWRQINEETRIPRPQLSTTGRYNLPLHVNTDASSLSLERDMGRMSFSRFSWYSMASSRQTRRPSPSLPREIDDDADSDMYNYFDTLFGGVESSSVDRKEQFKIKRPKVSPPKPGGLFRLEKDEADTNTI
ncbi:uncharacterized protein LOC141911364 [Tubulanus polymorphus]|uniref:uncharacterized protein LOC141911364 n=1 Tax=Tubulanus polymorphus TaxID=672921 RepID=UPI003DA66EF3